MRKLVTILLFCLVSTIASSQPRLPPAQNCADAVQVIELLTGSDYKEFPYWRGTNASGQVILFVNDKTGSWTIVLFSGDTACMIGAGAGSRPLTINI